MVEESASLYGKVNEGDVGDCKYGARGFVKNIRLFKELKVAESVDQVHERNTIVWPDLLADAFLKGVLDNLASPDPDAITDGLSDTGEQSGQHRRLIIRRFGDDVFQEATLWFLDFNYIRNEWVRRESIPIFDLVKLNSTTSNGILEQVKHARVNASIEDAENLLEQGAVPLTAKNGQSSGCDGLVDSAGACRLGAPPRRRFRGVLQCPGLLRECLDHLESKLPNIGAWGSNPVQVVVQQVLGVGGVGSKSKKLIRVASGDKYGNLVRWGTP